MGEKQAAVVSAMSTFDEIQSKNVFSLEFFPSVPTVDRGVSIKSNRQNDRYVIQKSTALPVLYTHSWEVVAPPSRDRWSADGGLHFSAWRAFLLTSEFEVFLSALKIGEQTENHI